MVQLNQLFFDERLCPPFVVAVVVGSGSSHCLLHLLHVLLLFLLFLVAVAVVAVVVVGVVAVIVVVAPVVAPVAALVVNYSYPWHPPLTDTDVEGKNSEKLGTTVARKNLEISRLFRLLLPAGWRRKIETIAIDTGVTQEPQLQHQSQHHQHVHNY